MTCWAIIPVRKNSKGIPGKNHSLLGGMPLFERAIRKCLASNVDGILVATDDPIVQEQALKLGVQCPALRPAATATDGAHMFLVYRFAAQVIAQIDSQAEYFVAHLATTPFTPVSALNEAVEMLRTRHYDWVFSVNPAEHHPYRMMTLDRGSLTPFSKASATELWANRQQLPEIYRFNGGVIGGTFENLAGLEEYNVDGLGTYRSRVGAVQIESSEAFDIDYAIDLEIATLMGAREPALLSLGSPIG